MDQLSLFDLPAPHEAPLDLPVGSLDPEAQRWLVSAGYTPEACVLFDPARIAVELTIVETLLDQGAPIDFDALDDLSRYLNNARYGASYSALHLLPRYDALGARMTRAIIRVLEEAQ